MRLVIAEKPSVGRAIYPVLGADTKKNGYMEGNGYIVSWCFGHLVGLKFPDEYCEEWAAKPWTFDQLPMLPEQWQFKVHKDCRDQFMLLKKLMNDPNVDEIICATDADREGECIFRYVYNLAGCRKPVKRLWVSSLEESAVRDGFAKLRSSKEYDSLFSAGFCRAKADWLVGMNGSRLFSTRYRQHLTLGRVQTPTLAMIVQRDSEVKNFVKKKYFTVELDCGGFTASSDWIDDEAKANALVSAVSGKTAIAADVSKEIKTVNPPKLFDLTTLQREANKQFGYTAKQTLDALQALYEAKLSTYPRTDSRYLSDDMEQSTFDLVTLVFDKFPEIGQKQSIDVKRCINNAKVTGHHAILPTENISTADIQALPDDQRNVLLLISAQLIMATAEPHKYEAVRVVVRCENTDFTANGRTIIKGGWKLLEEAVRTLLKNNHTEKKEEIRTLPDITKGQEFENVSASRAEHWTSSPKPYTEDTLLSAMEHAGLDHYDDESEKKGLGTPATRAATIEGLIDHGYAERKKKQITATEKGIRLIQVVPDEVKSPKLTSDWEMLLQQIEHGNYQADQFMSDITNFVRNICETYGKEDTSVSFNESQEAIGKCPKCGGEIKKGKYGYYCTDKCGMNVAKVYGKELTEAQLTKLLSGKEISYTANGKKTVVLPEIEQNDYQGKTYFQWKTKDSGNTGTEQASIGKCPKCGGEVKSGKYGFYCTAKCGMNIAKVYGYELKEEQLKKLLSGKEISYTANDKKTIVLPELEQNDYQGKTYFQWKTKKE